jgi:hypothetical protein
MLLRNGGWDRDAASEELRRRHREGKSLSPQDVKREGNGLYLAVIRAFGSFQDCYDLLGFYQPRFPAQYRRELHDPEALLRSIREKCRPSPASDAISGADLSPYAHLASLARRHFGSWDEGLRRARLRGVEHLDTLRYADPCTVDADLKRLLAGRLRGKTRRQLLLRHAQLVHGSVLGALESAGASRERALAVRASPGPRYRSGAAVLAAVRSRLRAGLPVKYRPLVSGPQRDRALVDAGSFVFGTWEATLRAADPSRSGEDGPP